MSIADLITDALAYARLGEIANSNDGYKAAYVVILCFGVVTTGLSLAYRFRNARLMRAHVLALGQQGLTLHTSSSAARRQAQQHLWELTQTRRTMSALALSLLSVAVQGAVPNVAAVSHNGSRDVRTSSAVTMAGLPMSILNCYLILLNEVLDKLVRMFSCSLAAGNGKFRAGSR
jgi:hypothetical protein